MNELSIGYNYETKHNRSLQKQQKQLSNNFL